MKVSDYIKLAVALAALAAASIFFVQFLRGGRSGTDRVYFYDTGAKRLFAAPRTSVPPIWVGNKGESEAVRALVISTNGHPKDKTSLKIAYLEKYSPALKTQMEAAQETGEPLKMSRSEAMAHRFVRRLEDADWFPMNSAEAEQILNEAALPGPNGVTPVVCAP